MVALSAQFVKYLKEIWWKLEEKIWQGCHFNAEKMNSLNSIQIQILFCLGYFVLYLIKRKSYYLELEEILLRKMASSEVMEQQLYRRCTKEVKIVFILPSTYIQLHNQPKITLMTFNHQKSNCTRDGGKKRQSHKLSGIIGSKER